MARPARAVFPDVVRVGAMAFEAVAVWRPIGAA